MPQLGLIGYPLSHSFSKKYFDEKFQKLNRTDFSFSVFSMPNVTELPALIKQHPDLIGLSVTIPHKETVIPFLHEIDEEAKQIGAVNCLKVKDGKLKGYNTDVFGFKQSLRPFLDVNHTRALVFGTGGAAKAVAHVLKNLNIDVWFVTREKKESIPNSLTYSELTDGIVAACKLLVNTTPVGMHPNVNECPPLPYNAITPQHLAYDLTYNPAETLFLQKAKQQGALISNGYNMLCFQADKAWEIWNE